MTILRIYKSFIIALKCKTLGAEVAHAYALYYNIVYINICAFYPDDRLPNLNARR